jgi:hypothetical protein
VGPASTGSSSRGVFYAQWTMVTSQAKVWLESEFKSRVPVVGGERQYPASCKPTGGQVRCVVRLGVVDAGGELGIWTAKVAKRSWPPAVIEVTVRFGPL